MTRRGKVEQRRGGKGKTVVRKESTLELNSNVFHGSRKSLRERGSRLSCPGDSKKWCKKNSSRFTKFTEDRKSSCDKLDEKKKQEGGEGKK